MARWPYGKGPFSPYDWAQGPNPDSPQARGLVGWWPTARSRGNSALLRDLSNRGANATPAGTPAWSSNAIIGSAISGDGTANAVWRTTAFTGLVAQVYTLSVWCVPTAAAYQYALSVTTNDGVNYCTLGIDSSGYARLEHRGDASKVIGGAVSLVNTPVLLTGVIDGTSLRQLYANGRYVTQGTDAVTQTAPNYVNVGKLRGTSGYWTGLIGDARIYDRALSATEIWQLYTQPWDLYTVPRLWAVAALASGNTGTAAITTQPAALSATGKLVFAATGALVAVAAALSGVGAQVISGAGGVTTQPAAIAATAKQVITGAGAVTTQPMALSGTATQTIAGTGGLQGQPVTFDATGKLVYAGTGAITTAPAALSGNNFVATPIISLTLTARSFELTLEARSVELTLYPRSVSLTLDDRE